MSAISIFKIKKEERILFCAMLLVFIFFNALLIYSHYSIYTMGAHGGFWSLFTKNFRMSGYDCWSWITISGMRIHFDTIRHPLYLTFLYPLYLLNNSLIDLFGYNFAVYFMAVIIIFSAIYSTIFIYRVFREVMELTQKESCLLTIFLFSFAHVLVPTMVPDHFIISMMFLTMTLYIVGIKMKKNRNLKPWQSFILLFFTAGMASSNAAKTILAGIFTNGWKKTFHKKFLFIGIILPLLILFGIRQYQYYTLEVPQKEVINNIVKHNMEKDAAKTTDHFNKRNKWLKEHTGKAAGNGPITKLIDISTPRLKTLIENFFGESLILHKKYLLKDVSWDRPIFVTYTHAYKYAIECVIILMFVIGCIIARGENFLQMLLTWFACDITLHIILGFGINEVYIMTAGWAFIIPISIGFFLKRLNGKYRNFLQVTILLLTLYLAFYNCSQIFCYNAAFNNI